MATSSAAAAAPKGAVARVNGALLKKYTGQEVRLIGQFDGADQKGNISVTASDGARITIQTTNPGQYATKFVEVIGVVTGDASIQESRCLTLGGEFDLAQYNKAVNAAEKFPALIH